MKTPGQIIPILIICHNNHLYVENTLRQLKKFNLNLQIMDNASTNPKTIKYLKEVDVPVIWNETNEGPWVSIFKNVSVYEKMPQKFIITDPDLQYNTNLPYNFVDIMIDLSIEYETHKLALAMDISDFSKMYQSKHYSDNRNIYDTEIGHWSWRVNIGESSSKYEMYFTSTDTTFHLIDKIGYHSTVRSIRIAGDFTAKHIPWYIENPIMNIYNLYTSYKNTEKISTMANIIIPEIEAKYFVIEKNNELFLINNDCKNDIDIGWCEEEIGKIEEDSATQTNYILKNKKLTTVLLASRRFKEVIFIGNLSDNEQKCIMENCSNLRFMNEKDLCLDPPNSLNFPL
jgi:hypothetical protein